MTEHRVVGAEPAGYFKVVSGRSGKTYLVTPLGGDRADCTCEAGRHGRICSHVRAVRAYAADLLSKEDR